MVFKKKCNITLGCNPCNVPAPLFMCRNEDFANNLVHELTHCAQFATEGKTKDCGEKLCREIRAYYRGDSDPSGLLNNPRTLIAIAWSSVYDDQKCKGHLITEYMPKTDDQIKEFVEKCIGDLAPNTEGKQ